MFASGKEPQHVRLSVLGGEPIRRTELRLRRLVRAFWIEDAMNLLEQMTLEESRDFVRRRARKNLLVVLLLVGFVGAVFFASFGHILGEMRPAQVETQPE
jgi:hypothetical protein